MAAAIGVIVTVTVSVAAGARPNGGVNVLDATVNTALSDAMSGIERIKRVGTGTCG